MIILKYVRRELIYTVITVTALLILIGMSNQIATILDRAVHGELAKNAVLYIVAFSFPYFLVMLIPIGVFIGVYLVFTRLYAEQEIIILKMSGFSNLDLLKIMTVPLLFITLLSTFANLWLVPAVLRYRDILMEKAAVVDAVTMLASGHFQVVAGGKYVIYVQDADPAKKTLSHVFVAEQPKETNSGNKSKDRWDIFISNKGSEEEIPDSDNKRFIKMNHGVQYQGLPGQNDFYQMKFEDYSFEVPQQSFKGKLRGRAKSTQELLRSTNIRDRAELQSRISMIVAPCVLALLALSLSRLGPRQGRFAKLFPAIVLVLIYYNLMLANEDWLARGYIPMLLGTWWLHLSTIGFAGYLLFKDK